MKRSMTVSLVLLGSAAISLSGCKPKAESYPSVEACEAAGQHTDQECRDGFAAAQREHEASAPHFQSRDDCIAAYGPSGCEERHAEGGGSFFMPMMLGYMLGRGMGYHPLYQDPRQSGCMVGNGGARFGSCGGGGGFFGGGSGGAGSVASRAGTAVGGAETSTVARGGFGSVGAGLSAGE
jgi:uncharacterized protein YgiB involved in biofilm formation